jgi:hypothetical protein
MSQLLLSSMFSYVTKDENHKYVERVAEVDRLAHMAQAKASSEVGHVVKKPVGRPRRPRNLEVSLVPYVPPSLSKPSFVRAKRRVRGAYTKLAYTRVVASYNSNYETTPKCSRCIDVFTSCSLHKRGVKWAL